MEGRFVYGDNVYIPEEDMDEDWEFIKGFPDYRISNHGNIWSGISQQFMHPTPVGRCGHLDVCFRVNGERHHRYVHRLVAEAFIPNPYNLPFVRHLDDNPNNNWVDNLEWGTQSDNMQDAIENGRFRFFTEDDIRKANIVRSTPIRAINLNTGEEYVFESQQEAERQLGVKQSCISSSLRRSNGYYKRIYKFEFLDKEKYLNGDY